MKRVALVVVILILSIYGGIVLINQVDESQKDNLFNMPQLKSKQQDKQLINYMNGDVFTWIDQTDEDLLEQLGEPNRKDVSAYDYTWWVYNIDETQYIQFGLEDNRIVTVYTTGDDISTEPFLTGNSYESLNQEYSFKDEVTYQNGLSFYTFILNEEDLLSQPLLKLSKDTFVQLYFDTITNELASLRLMTGDVLLRHRFYEMTYRGKLPEVLTELDDTWENIEVGLEKQIFDLTNIFRTRHEKDQLVWDETVGVVAYNHSRDMSDNNYFSHYGQDGSGLKERLGTEDIYYLAAGENIAAQHSDAPAAVHGWLNSEGHREALLNDDYNYLGVGVYRLYYTQNFIYKP